MNKKIFAFSLLSIAFALCSCQRALPTLSEFAVNSCQEGESDASHELQGIIQGKSLKDGNPISNRLVALMITQDNQTSLCTGALLPGNIILTAAHCAAKSDITLVFHSNVHCLTPNNAAEHTRPVSKIMVHPLYASAEKSESSNYDLAMIKFQGRGPEGKQIFNLPLAPVLLDGSETLFVAGYGTTDPTVNTGGILRLTTQSAARIHRDVNHVSSFRLDQPESGVCSGDSGGPLFVQKEGKLQLVGVASKVVNRTSDKAKKCSDQAIYVDLSQHLEWIKKTYIELRKD